MCERCPGDCAHDRETDEWIVPDLTPTFREPSLPRDGGESETNR